MPQVVGLFLITPLRIGPRGVGANFEVIGLRIEGPNDAKGYRIGHHVLVGGRI